MSHKYRVIIGFKFSQNCVSTRIIIEYILDYKLTSTEHIAIKVRALLQLFLLRRQGVKPRLDKRGRPQGRARGGTSPLAGQNNEFFERNQYLLCEAFLHKQYVFCPRPLENFAFPGKKSADALGDRQPIIAYSMCKICQHFGQEKKGSYSFLPTLCALSRRAEPVNIGLTGLQPEPLSELVSKGARAQPPIYFLGLLFI